MTGPFPVSPPILPTAASATTLAKTSATSNDLVSITPQWFALMTESVRSNTPYQAQQNQTLAGLYGAHVQERLPLQSYD